MLSWSEKRKLSYTAIVSGVVIIIVAFIYTFFFWQPPTCFDNVKNGDETGVDCGGGCIKLCPNQATDPVVLWDPRVFKIAPEIYSTLVYIENSNLNSKVKEAHYSFTFYDENNSIILEKKGVTSIPKSKTFGIFEGPIKSEKLIKRATFSFEGDFEWIRDNSVDPEIKISHGPVTGVEIAPRIEGFVSNESLFNIKNIEMVAAVFDSSGNAIGGSRTFVSNLPKGESFQIFFTWPTPFAVKEFVCEKPSNTILLIDRSGSMASLGNDPPQPLTDVKNAAKSFIDSLGISAKVGVISFASEASNPIDINLTEDQISAKNRIDDISIIDNGIQYTNIFGAFNSAKKELNSSRRDQSAIGAVILLTDGVANKPSIADEESYAEEIALKESQELKSSGIKIFSIGLGEEINKDFLNKISSSPEHTFFTINSKEISSIYKKISTSLCKEIPARVEITYKFK